MRKCKVRDHVLAKLSGGRIVEATIRAIGSTISGGESELLSGHLRELVAMGVGKLLVNIRDLSQVDSSGVGILIETYVSLKRH